MKFASLFCLSSLLVLAAAEARPLEALSVVPADAVSVGMIRLSELRSSPLAGRILSHMDRTTVDGEAEGFLREAGFHPLEDVDTIVFSLAPGNGESSEANVLVVLEGRFDTGRLAGAITSRGGVRVQDREGTYYRLSASMDRHDEDGAVALLSSRMALVGNERAVRAALSATRRGGTDFVRAGGLAHLLGRVDQNSSAWLLIDVPRSTRLKGETQIPGHGRGNDALQVALRNVSVMAVWADDRGDQLSLGATAVSNDDETLALLEDLLRGMLATWRLGAQEKAPDLVPAIRRFQVDRRSDSITLSGSIADELLQKLAGKSRRGYGK